LNCSYNTLESGFYVSIETKNPTQSTISQRLESEENHNRRIRQTDTNEPSVPLFAHQGTLSAPPGLLEGQMRRRPHRPAQLRDPRQYCGNGLEDKYLEKQEKNGMLGGDENLAFMKGAPLFRISGFEWMGDSSADKSLLRLFLAVTIALTAGRHANIGAQFFVLDPKHC